MPRREKELHEFEGPVPRFALGLRELRRRAGSPTYRQLSARTHFSASTLSVAASGWRLPTREVALAYARSCGADTAEWDRLWRAARAESESRGGPVRPLERGPGVARNSPLRPVLAEKWTARAAWGSALTATLTFAAWRIARRRR